LKTLKEMTGRDFLAFFCFEVVEWTEERDNRDLTKSVFAGNR
jgi:hypothetical protein